jgi:hypothetical protein
MTTPDYFGGQVSLIATTNWGSSYSPNTISTFANYPSGKTSLTLVGEKHILTVKDFFGIGKNYTMDIMAGMLVGTGATKWKFWPDGNFEYYNNSGTMVFQSRTRSPSTNLRNINNTVDGNRIILNDEGWMAIFYSGSTKITDSALLWQTGPTKFTSSQDGLNFGRSDPLWSSDKKYSLTLSTDNSSTLIPNLFIKRHTSSTISEYIWMSDNFNKGTGPPYRYRIDSDVDLVICDKDYKLLWIGVNNIETVIKERRHLSYTLKTDGNFECLIREDEPKSMLWGAFSTKTYDIIIPPNITSTLNYYYTNYKIDRFIYLSDGKIYERYFNKGSSPSISVSDSLCSSVQRTDLNPSNNWLYIAPQLQDGSFLLIQNDRTVWKAPPGPTIRYIESIGKLKDDNNYLISVRCITQMINKRFVAIDDDYNILISDSIDINTTKFKKYRIGKQNICYIQQLIDSTWIYRMNNDTLSCLITKPSILPPITCAGYEISPVYISTEVINNNNGVIERKFIKISNGNEVHIGSDKGLINSSINVNNLLGTITSSCTVTKVTSIIPVYNGYLLNYIFYNKYNISDSLTNNMSNYLYDKPLSNDKIPLSILKPMLTNTELVYKFDDNYIPVESDSTTSYILLSYKTNTDKIIVDDNLQYPGLTLDIFKKLWKDKRLSGENDGGTIILYPDYKYMAVTMKDSTKKLTKLSDLTSYEIEYAFGKSLPPDSQLYQGYDGTYGGNIKNTTLFTVGRSSDSTVSRVKNTKDTWSGITWKLYDLSIDLN